MNTTYGVLNNSSLIVDTDKLRENVRTILRSLPAGTKLIPVVKDDAYGMGMVGVARTLSAFPEIGCFAVANVSEGVTLRREGIRQDILIMGSTLPFQYAPAVECDLTVTVSRLGMVPELAEVCKAQSKPLNVQIKLETGMHRIGVEPGEELAALIGELKAAQEWVHVTGAFSHFAWPGNAEVCEAQYKKLLAGAEQLKAAGIPVPMCHISASPCALAAGSIWTIRKSRSATFRRSSPGAVISPTSSSATRATRSPTSASTFWIRIPSWRPSASATATA